MNTIEYELSPKEHLRFQLKSTFIKKRIVLYAAILFILAVTGGGRYYIPVFAFFLISWFFVVYFSLRAKVKKGDDLFQPALKFEYDSENIKFESKETEIQMPWSCLYSFIEYSGFFDVSLPYFPVFIPKRAFTAERLAEFRGLLQKNSSKKSKTIVDNKTETHS